MAVDYPVCSRPNERCMSMDDWGRCAILSVTNFGKRSCPFYKERVKGKEANNGKQRQ